VVDACPIAPAGLALEDEALVLAVLLAEHEFARLRAAERGRLQWATAAFRVKTQSRACGVIALGLLLCEGDASLDGANRPDPNQCERST
jgi:hypothetical protein